ncbi:hypothetical protein [Streptomyces sp. NPDC005989]|uniref:hypothetical protein n=1 Tax=unclassified Streptomyces TaxID=2593676 RepID=UPI0033F99A2A
MGEGRGSVYLQAGSVLTTGRGCSIVVGTVTADSKKQAVKKMTAKPDAQGCNTVGGYDIYPVASCEDASRRAAQHIEDSSAAARRLCATR